MGGVIGWCMHAKPKGVSQGPYDIMADPAIAPGLPSYPTRNEMPVPDAEPRPRARA